MTWREFLQRNADKVLLILVLHGMMALLLTQLQNPTVLDWIKGEIATVLGALLMLITGRATHPEPIASTTVTATTTVKPEEPVATPVPTDENQQ